MYFQVTIIYKDETRQPSIVEFIPKFQAVIRPEPDMDEVNPLDPDAFDSAAAAIKAALKTARGMTQNKFRPTRIEVAVYLMGKLINGAIEHTDYRPFYTWSIDDEVVSAPDGRGMTYRPLPAEFELRTGEKWER